MKSLQGRLINKKDRNTHNELDSLHVVCKGTDEFYNINTWSLTSISSISSSPKFCCIIKRKHSKKADITAEHSEKLVLVLSVDSLRNNIYVWLILSWKRKQAIQKHQTKDMENNFQKIKLLNEKLRPTNQNIAQLEYKLKLKKSIFSKIGQQKITFIFYSWTNPPANFKEKT